MNIKACEIVNYVFAVTAMILFFIGSIDYSLIPIKIIMLFLADICFLVVSRQEKVKDKNVLILDTIVFFALAIIHVSLFCVPKYLVNIFSTLAFVLLFYPVNILMFILLAVGYFGLKKTRTWDKRYLEQKTISTSPNINQYSNTDIEREFIDEYRKNNPN